MADTSDQSVLGKVRQALGRAACAAAAPVPPALSEPVTRQVHMAIGLPELFARCASDNKMKVQPLRVEQLHEHLIAFLREHNCRKIALPQSVFLEKLRIIDALKAAGFDARLWTEMTLDEIYDFDCGVTDVYCAVAEIGGLVIRPTPLHGRALSLVPPIHVAILEPKNFVPDLVDLFEKLG